MITLIFANPGSGKTTFLARELRKAVKTKKHKYIMTNIDVDIDAFAPAKVIYVEDIRDILKYKFVEDTLLLIDEAGIIWNNRNYKNFTNNELRFFKLHRHCRTDLILVSQDFSDLDLSIRRLYDRLYLLERTNPLWRFVPFFGSHFMFHITKIKEISKFITINEDTNTLEEGYKWTHQGFPAFINNYILGRGWFNRKLYYKYFDSYELPNDITLYQPDKKYDLQNLKKTFI